MKSDNYSLGDNGFFLLTGGCISTATRFLLWGSSPMLASDLEYLLVEGTTVPDSDGTREF